MEDPKSSAVEQWMLQLSKTSLSALQLAFTICSSSSLLNSKRFKYTSSFVDLTNLGNVLMKNLAFVPNGLSVYKLNLKSLNCSGKQTSKELIRPLFVFKMPPIWKALRFGSLIFNFFNSFNKFISFLFSRSILKYNSSIFGI